MGIITGYFISMESPISKTKPRTELCILLPRGTLAIKKAFFLKTGFKWNSTHKLWWKND